MGPEETNTDLKITNQYIRLCQSLFLYQIRFTNGRYALDMTCTTNKRVEIPLEMVASANRGAAQHLKVHTKGMGWGPFLNLRQIYFSI